MWTDLTLNRHLALNTNADPDDVLAAKTVLHRLGFYEPPEWGVTQYADRALFDAIKAFQDSQNLRVDGVMKPGGESETVLKGYGRAGATTWP